MHTRVPTRRCHPQSLLVPSGNGEMSLSVPEINAIEDLEISGSANARTCCDKNVLTECANEYELLPRAFRRVLRGLLWGWNHRFSLIPEV